MNVVYFVNMLLLYRSVRYDNNVSKLFYKLPHLRVISALLCLVLFMFSIIYKYCKIELDYDDTYFYCTKNDVSFNRCNKIENKIDEYRKLITQTYYIKRNRLFYTYRGKKYVSIISCSADEYNFIDIIMRAIRYLGAKDIVYLKGVLD